jgi:hypothetical protein
MAIKNRATLATIFSHEVSSLSVLLDLVLLLLQRDVAIAARRLCSTTRDQSGRNLVATDSPIPCRCGPNLHADFQARHREYSYAAEQYWHIPYREVFTRDSLNQHEASDRESCDWFEWNFFHGIQGEAIGALLEDFRKHLPCYRQSPLSVKAAQ